MKSHWLLAMLLLLGGCGTWQSKPQSAPVPTSRSKYQFDYKVTNGEPIFLVRVFDDGGSTYFQFRSGPPNLLVISSETDSGEAIIPHEVMGNYAVIRGVYRHSSIRAAAQSVAISKLGAIASMASVGPVILPKVSKESVPKLELNPLPVLANNTVRDSIGLRQIRFRRNSTVLGPKERKALAEMTARAAGVGEVEIRVRAFYPNRRASVRLAEARAKVIRLALVNSGIAESQIRISQNDGANALVAEVGFHAAQSQAIRDPVPIRTSNERDSTSSNGVKLFSPSTLKLSTQCDTMSLVEVVPTSMEGTARVTG